MSYSEKGLSFTAWVIYFHGIAGPPMYRLCDYGKVILLAWDSFIFKEVTKGTFNTVYHMFKVYSTAYYTLIET